MQVVVVQGLNPVPPNTVHVVAILVTVPVLVGSHTLLLLPSPRTSITLRLFPSPRMLSPTSKRAIAHKLFWSMLVHVGINLPEKLSRFAGVWSRNNAQFVHQVDRSIEILNLFQLKPLAVSIKRRCTHGFHRIPVPIFDLGLENGEDVFGIGTLHKSRSADK